VVETLRARGLTLRVLVAFAAIYLVWGSTYLAIRIAIEEIPPLVLVAARLLAGGVILLAWSVLRGEAWPRGIEWRNAALVGVLLTGVGNSTVTLGETRVASGLVALLVATVPLWVALFSAFGPRAERPRPAMWAGLAVGFAGIVLLMGPGLSAPGRAGVSPAWALVPVAGSLSWAWGSLWSRRARLPASPMMGTAVGLVAAGVAVGAVSLASGELAHGWPAHVGVPALASLAYLVVFGSVVGFTAYLYLLRHVSPTVVSTYAFVNPVVAMALGWAFTGEALSARTLAAAALVLASVALITAQRARALVARPAPADSRRPGARDAA